MQYANYVQPTVEIGGETYEVKLEIVDNRTSAENGPSAAAELMNRDVSIVLGSYGSGVSMAGGEVFAEAGVPAIGVTCTNPQVTADCDVYFRICFLDPFQGTVLANYAWNSGVTTAYTLAMLGSDYDQGLVYYFSEAFKALGGTVTSEDFPEGNANFVSYINNAKSAGAGVIFAPVSTNYAQLIIEAAGAQGFEGHLLGSDTWDNNMVIESAKGKSVNVEITTFYQEGGAPEFDAGIKEWMNSNADALTNNGGNDMVSAVTAMGYDAYFTALEAIKNAGSTAPADVMAALCRQVPQWLCMEHFHPPGCEHSLCSFSSLYAREKAADGSPSLRWLPDAARSCCGPAVDKVPVPAAEGARKSRQFVASHWRGDDSPRDGGKAALADDFGRFLARAGAEQRFTLSCMAFQDALSLDVERVRGCCIHVVRPDGRMIPFCLHNLTSTEGRMLYPQRLACGEEGHDGI